MPVTLEAAEKEPIFSGLEACASSFRLRSTRSTWPSEMVSIVMTSQIDSRQGI